MADFNALKAIVDTSQIDKMRDAFKDVKNEIPGASSAVESFGTIVEMLANPLLAIGTALAMATAGAVALGFRAIEAADGLNDMIGRTGKSAEYLQVLSDVAVKSGSDLKSMLDMLDSVQKKATAGGEEGKKTGKAYEYLGVSARDASGALKDSATLVEEGQAALEKLGHSADATAAFQDAFGSSALKMGASIKGLNEEMDKQYDYLASVGALMDSNLASAADEYNDKLHDLGSAFQGLGQDIARMMLPALTGMADALINSAKNSGALGTAFDVLKGVAWVLVQAVKLVLTHFIAMDTAYAAVIQSITTGAKLIWAALTGNWDEIPKLWDQYKSRIVSTAADAAASVNKIWSTVEANPMSRDEYKKPKESSSGTPYNPYTKKDKAEKAERGPKESGIDQSILAEEQALIKLRAQYSALFDVRQDTHQQLLQAKIDNGDFAEKVDKTGKVIKLAATEQQIATAMAKAADADYLELLNRKTKAQLDAAKAADAEIKTARAGLDIRRITTSILKDFNATQGDVNIAVANYNVAQAETSLAIARAKDAHSDETIKLQEKLRVLRELAGVANAENTDDRAEAMRQSTFEYGWAKAFDSYRKDAGNAAKTAETLFNNTSKSMEDALVNFTMTGKLSFADLARSIIADIVRIQAKAAASNIAGVLTKIIGGAFSPYAGSSNNPSAANYENQMDLGVKLATGTNYVPYDGMPAILHKGEAVVPKQYNPAAGGQGSGGAMTNHISITVQGGNTNSETGAAVSTAVLKAMDGVAKRRIQTEQRPGGLFSPVA